ncbi:uncharacterized protein LOC135153504 [Lytechinus pictus]|uniref:uncharacterized protein LOC135153504 n=1 Tax=Lytechinus pictus TaxID=7653 RepID=UPI0030BA1A3F
MGGPDRPRRGKGGSLADNSPKPKRPSPADNSAAQNDDTDGDDSTLSNAIQAAINKLLTNENFISKLVSAIKTKLLDEICESLRSEVRDSLKFDIDNANDKMALLEKRVDVVEDAMDEAEQYSRRNCLIFAGINETQDEDVERKIVNICKEDLGVTINESDVDRCHRLGSPNNKGQKTRKQHRDVIVKFTNYRKRDSIYKARFNLRKSSSKSKHIYINESLTQKRNKLYWKVKKSLRSNDYKLWTQDGKIIVKKPNGEKVSIASEKDLSKVN